MINELPNTDWAKRIILRVEVGSTAHGTGLPGKEDYDEIAVMSTPWEKAIGIPVASQSEDCIEYRPGRERNDKSGPGDWDLTVYSAKKFAGLAAQGNPSILVALFGPVVQSDRFGEELLDLAQNGTFHSQQARNRFLGYAKSQRTKLEQGLVGQKVKRSDLIQEFGWDTKFGMHMVRLGFQGIEFMETGRLELPIPGETGEILRQIRRGEHKIEFVLDLANENEAKLEKLGNDAPIHPDYSRINDWLISLHDSQRPTLKRQ